MRRRGAMRQFAVKHRWLLRYHPFTGDLANFLIVATVLKTLVEFDEGPKVEHMSTTSSQMRAKVDQKLIKRKFKLPSLKN